MTGIHQIPQEVVQMVVEELIKMGAEGSVVEFATTNREWNSKVLPVLYAFTKKSNSFSILCWAAEKGKIEVLKTALRFGADPNQIVTSERPFDEYRCWMPSADHHDFRPAPWKSQASYIQYDYITKIVRLSLPVHRNDCFTDIGGTIKSLSSQEVDELVRDWLSGSPAQQLRAGRQLPHIFQYWSTPLHTAVRGGKFEIVRQLLQAGANVNSTSYESPNSFPDRFRAGVTWTGPPRAATPLQVIMNQPVSPDYYKITKMLVSKGADQLVLSKSVTEAQPLPFAGSLLHQFLDPAVTPFLQPDWWFVHYLLDHGYHDSTRERDSRGRLPIDVALTSLHPLSDDIIETLLVHGGHVHGTFFRPAWLRSGVDEAGPMLTWAILGDQLKLARNLIEKHNVDTTATTTGQLGLTPLHALCTVPFLVVNEDLAPRTQLIQAVLWKSPDQVNKLTAFGSNSLMLAMLWYCGMLTCPSWLVLDTISCLIAHGADPFLGAEQGLITPLEEMIYRILWRFSHTINRYLFNDGLVRAAAVVRALQLVSHRARFPELDDAFWEVGQNPSQPASANFLYEQLQLYRNSRNT